MPQLFGRKQQVNKKPIVWVKKCANEQCIKPASEASTYCTDHTPRPRWFDDSNDAPMFMCPMGIHYPGCAFEFPPCDCGIEEDQDDPSVGKLSGCSEQLCNAPGCCEEGKPFADMDFLCSYHATPGGYREYMRKLEQEAFDSRSCAPNNGIDCHCCCSRHCCCLKRTDTASQTMCGELDFGEARLWRTDSASHTMCGDSGHSDDDIVEHYNDSCPHGAGDFLAGLLASQ